jgi:hypothetical protein
MKTTLCGLTTLTILTASLGAAEWKPVTSDLIKEEKPGFGGLCGVVVDHKSGDVIVNVSDRGFYRSADQGKSWAKLGKQVLMLDPVGEGKLYLMKMGTDLFKMERAREEPIAGGYSPAPVNKLSITSPLLSVTGRSCRSRTSAPGSTPRT